MNTSLLDHLNLFDLQCFDIKTLRLECKSLINNPLQDSTLRSIPVLVPKSVKPPYRVVLVLAGFTGNSPFYFNGKYSEDNFVQKLDLQCQNRLAPEALYVFVDAMTSWGGSQYLNSAATGNYEDMITQDLRIALHQHFTVSSSPEDWCIMGGSSGGYGALHLVSKFPQYFGVAAAIAPDCFFSASLVNELYLALPTWEKYQESGLTVLNALRNGQLKKQKNFHSILNAFAMSACYSPKGNNGDFNFPVSPASGNFIPDVWQHWLEKDPIQFLVQRDFYNSSCKLYLDVGNKDQFHLQYGARQIHLLAEKNQFQHHYSEFDGNHFDIGERRPELWSWLQTQWA
ncbi:MAG: alpha/beta hydrolase-fold protein [Bdellovibrionia bacterium]